MAVTTAQGGQEHRDAWISSGETGGMRLAGRELKPAPSDTSELSPTCSFDGHYNLVGAHHVQPRTRGRLDSARIVAQLINFYS
jgi:hypothetical protein